MNKFSNDDVEKLFDEYTALYEIPDKARQPGPTRDAILEQARIELGRKSFLSHHNYTAFTTNFEDLHGMKQLPGLAAQRVMAAVYGFAGEGDGRTAALVRMMKLVCNIEGPV